MGISLSPDLNHKPEPEIRVKILDLKEPEKNSTVNVGIWHSFIYIKDGSGILAIDFDEHIAITGKVFFIEKYKVWEWVKVDQLIGIMVQFTDAFYNHIYTGNPKIKSDQSLSGDFSPFIKICNENKPKWDDVFDLLVREYSSSVENSKEILCLSLKILIMMYRRNTYSKSRLIIADRKKQLLNEFRRLVNNQFIEVKTPKGYAQFLNITPNYLNAICKDIYDKTVSEIIQERVILEAKRLLVHTGMSVSEIAYKLGFSDNSYFGRYFKKAVGIPPEKFRSKEFKLQNV
ncbi:MAG: helix-turn-helix domain-containing protein [Alphaproteobacteria bacterium]|nr:helix-turn-helix domain-containing protein [Alphaproteobacteria bacterium]